MLQENSYTLVKVTSLTKEGEDVELPCKVDSASISNFTSNDVKFWAGNLHKYPSMKSLKIQDWYLVINKEHKIKLTNASDE